MPGTTGAIPCRGSTLSTAGVSTTLTIMVIVLAAEMINMVEMMTVIMTQTVNMKFVHSPSGIH